MNTVPCLLCYPWRTLTALGDVYRVSAHHHLDKKDVARELGAAIHARLSQTLVNLSPDALAALRALMQAENLAMPRTDFITRFGLLHPYRPWNPDAPPAPWPDPISPAATLAYYGLVYPLNQGSIERPLSVILLPEDLCDAIAEHLDITVPTLIPPLEPPPAPARAVDANMFAFLSFLNREDHPVRHGRWLPPRALQALNAHLSPPDDLGAGRSELQATRIPFLHYLAERAGLVGLVGDWLKPTLIAHEWLAAPYSQRLRILWDVWREPCDENRALWRRYRLPAIEEDDDPVARFHVLLDALEHVQDVPLPDALAEWEPALLRPQAAYAAWAALDSEERAEFQTRARAVLLALLTGPLTWFGVLASPSPHLLVSLSPLGAALLGRDGDEWPADPAPAALRVAPLLERTDRGTTVLLDAPAGLPLLDRFALEAILPPDPAAPGRYPLARSDLLHALQRGRTIAGVVNFFERASGEPLPAPVLGSLYRWADELDRVTIRQAVLLQTRDADLLRDLTGQRRVRETLGKTLNARTVEVRADRLNALLRRLAYRSITPRLDLPKVSPHPQVGEGLGEGERAAIAAALRIYAHLADELGLSTRPAYALAQRWSEGLPLPIREAVERTVEQTQEALHQAAPSEMEDRLPEPTGPLLETLESAVKEQSAVEIEYYTAGRAHLTVRRVEPLRLEWHGDVVYLIAHCHLRGDQRVFRVDRIARIANSE